MIRFDEVTKLYKGNPRPALNAIDLEILKGEFVFLVGASGSGKSSLLRLILKEDRPTSGQIHVLGQRLSTLSARKVPFFRRNIGVVFQDFRLLPNKTVFDNVAFTLQVIGKSRGFVQQAVPDVLQLVGLAGKAGRYPHELSGGEQQRVAIARAIVNRPAVLLADEPTGNLDPATSAGIMALLERINANGTTIVMATHDAAIVDRLQRRVVELVGGEIIRDERGGGYQTQAIPISEIADAGDDDAFRDGRRDGADWGAAPDPAAATTTAIPEHDAALDAAAEASRAAQAALAADDWEWSPRAGAAPASAPEASEGPISSLPPGLAPLSPPMRQSAPAPTSPPAPTSAPAPISPPAAKSAPESESPPIPGDEEPLDTWLDDLEDTILRAPRPRTDDEGNTR